MENGAQNHPGYSTLRKQGIPREPKQKKKKTEKLVTSSKYLVQDVEEGLGSARDHCATKYRVGSARDHCDDESNTIVL